MIAINKDTVVAVRPGKGTCELCDGTLDEIPSVELEYKILFKTFRKRACLPCLKDIRSLADLRIAQAERGEFGK